jgi:2-iminobutanoate/2-iminopropanoate deaminase
VGEDKNTKLPVEATIMEKKIIQTSDAPAAIGPYSQAVLVGETLYCSGQIALDPKSGELVKGSIADETKQVMKNIGAVLKAAGMDYGNVVKASIFMADMADYAEINKVYAEYFKENPPAREAVAVKTLPKEVGVEISVIAHR